MSSLTFIVLAPAFSSAPDLLDVSVRARGEPADVSVVAPANEIGRETVLAEHLQDFAVALPLAHVMSSDYEPIPRTGPQATLGYPLRSHFVLLSGLSSVRRSSQNRIGRVTDRRAGNYERGEYVRIGFSARTRRVPMTS
jgi:hypothetical protein